MRIQHRRRLVIPLVLGVVLVLVACAEPNDPPSTGSGHQQPTSSARAHESATRGTRTAGRRADAGAPQAITLPDGRSMPVRVAPTTTNGVLDVPADIREAGWWNGGSRLGDPFGSTLIAAHVDSATQGLGPFVSLLRARPGDRVRLHSHHLQQVFVITLAATAAAFVVRKTPRAAVSPRPPPPHPCDLRAAVRRLPRWLPEPGRPHRDAGIRPHLPAGPMTRARGDRAVVSLDLVIVVTAGIIAGRAGARQARRRPRSTTNPRPCGSRRRPGSTSARTSAPRAPSR